MIDPRFERAWGTGCLEKESVRLGRKNRHYRGAPHYWKKDEGLTHLMNLVVLGGSFRRSSRKAFLC